MEKNIIESAMYNPQKIVWLYEVGAKSPALVGSKAAKLAMLKDAGLKVPLGFCITATGVEDISADKDLTNHRESIDDSDDLCRGEKSKNLESGLREQVIAAYRTLKDQCGNDGKIAVRSSALLEDMGHASFAGQYKTILNVSSEAELLEAIEECRSSAYSFQADTYRMASGIQVMSPEMAVLVQVMIPAEIAGVLFTVDPLHDGNNNMLIEASQGLGEDIASGRVSGFRLTADRKSLEFSYLDSMSDEWTNLYSMYEWKKMLQLGLHIESLLGGPQDIEWAFGDGDFWILQSRPVTHRSDRKSLEIWSRANAGEIMPNVVTPLTWSIFKPVLQMAGHYRSRSFITVHWKWTHQSGKCPDSPQLYRGRAYMELGSVYMGFGGMPGVTPDILQRMLGFEYHMCNKADIPAKQPRWHVMDIYRGMRFWSEILGFTDSLAEEARKWSRSRKIEYRERGFLSQHLGYDEQDEWLNELLRSTAKILGLHIQCTSMAFSAFGLLDRLLKKYLDAEQIQEFESGLLADFQLMGTVQQNRAIWDLAREAQSKASVSETIMKDEPAQTIINKWKSDPDASRYMRLWDSFMSRFGDRGTEEFELAAAHWDEDPTFVIDRIREIIKLQIPNPMENMESRHDEWSKERSHVYEFICSKGGRIDAWLFQRLVDQYRKYVPLRENLKYLVVGCFNQLRKIFMSLGVEFHNSGILANANDILFLEYGEIRKLRTFNQQYMLEVNRVIQKRRDEYVKNVEYKAPGLWISVNGKEQPLELSLTGDDNVLHGIGCSHGVATGKAFVFSSLNNDAAMESGSVLVASSIDPGLTPLFLGASGLVTEIGGILSHGATVAREYGLPAVVGVPRVTEIIKHGQLVTIDGSTGTVYVKGHVQ